MIMFRHESVRKLYPNVITTVDDKSYDSSGNLVNVDEDLVLKENAKLEKEFLDQEYARKREAEYPSTGDQLDMMYKDTKNSTTTHADAVEAVKTKWPKDNSGPVE